MFVPFRKCRYVYAGRWSAPSCAWYLHLQSNFQSLAVASTALAHQPMAAQGLCLPPGPGSIPLDPRPLYPYRRAFVAAQPPRGQSPWPKCGHSTRRAHSRAGSYQSAFVKVRCIRMVRGAAVSRYPCRQALLRFGLSTVYLTGQRSNRPDLSDFRLLSAQI